MTRYWCSWWTRFLPHQPVPFSYWTTGIRARDEAYSVCAVVDAYGEADLWVLVRTYFAAPEARFCIEQPDGWMPPGDRFPEDARA